MEFEETTEDDKCPDALPVNRENVMRSGYRRQP